MIVWCDLKTARRLHYQAFSPRETRQRVKAVYAAQKCHRLHARLIEIDQRLKIDFDRREIWLEGKW